MLAYMKDILKEAEKTNTAVAGFNVFGYEDAVAVVRAAESLNKPVLLMVNKPAAQHMPVPIIGSILRKVARAASVPVGVHLDHAKEMSLIAQALETGFTSVMFDGSDLPFEENVRLTNQVVKMAAIFSAGVEAEIGMVGYSDSGLASESTDPAEAKAFAEQTGVDALAVSVGTVHRLTTQRAKLDLPRLQKIHSMVATPLVIHGASGLPDASMPLLGENGVRKVNFGTKLRMVFGKTLRKQMEENPEIFDRIQLFQKCMEEVQAKAADTIKKIS
ncbi:MAG: class II fructose-bisphosphate aldolase [Oscillospiraceae bacterium]